MSNPILLYDGVCGLCNRTVQFVLARDRDALFRFAPLQSPFAAPLLRRHGINPSDLDTLYLVRNHEYPDERLLPRSEAVVFILRQLGGFWWLLGTCIQVVPRPVRDWAYTAIAQRRYRIFGKYDSCPVPSHEQRSRFLDV